MREHLRHATPRSKRVKPLVTTDFVVDETLTLIRFRLGAAAAEAWWQQVDRSSRLRWERVDNDRFEKARALFFQYRDKDFSFTDCTSETRATRALRPGVRNLNLRRSTFI